MLSWFTSRAHDRRTAIDFYGAIVAQARQPAFFTRYGVVDSPEGRTAVIILLLFPLLERLQAGDTRARRVARFLCETFVTDIDDCLREMGVGDLTVPKKVKRAAQALGERCLAYRRAAGGSEPAKVLAEELATSIPGLENDPRAAEALACYTLGVAADLGAVPAEALLSSGSAALPQSVDIAAFAPRP